MVRLVQDKEGARAEIAEEIAQGRDVGLLGEQTVRQDEARAGGPGIDGEPVQAAQLGQALAVDDVEGQAKFGLQLVLPLQRHGGRCGHQNEVDPPPQQELAQDETGLYGLAETHVVGDQHIDARQAQRLAQRQKLVGIEPYAGAEGGLEQVAIGSGGGIPAHRAQVGAKRRRVVCALCGQRLPGVVPMHRRRNLGIPQDIECFALGVISHACQAQRRQAVVPRDDTLDQPGTSAQLHERTEFR
jgi:hypothetical protein